eukprot:TRINITY_DN1432_c0_g1_i1.p1 TRINITY_DN1432_c0_g1~~TRINITY_DN1432_c0_g1_i1.p1  ORF type:complete len:245 (+),score=13.83 TRINITY_DN1432_c0_g1_i1:96-737(+)
MYYNKYRQINQYTKMRLKCMAFVVAILAEVVFGTSIMKKRTQSKVVPEVLDEATLLILNEDEEARSTRILKMSACELMIEKKLLELEQNLLHLEQNYIGNINKVYDKLTAKMLVKCYKLLEVDVAERYLMSELLSDKEEIDIFTYTNVEYNSLFSINASLALTKEEVTIAALANTTNSEIAELAAGNSVVTVENIEPITTIYIQNANLFQGDI